MDGRKGVSHTLKVILEKNDVHHIIVRSNERVKRAVLLNFHSLIA